MSEKLDKVLSAMRSNPELLAIFHKTDGTGLEEIRVERIVPDEVSKKRSVGFADAVSSLDIENDDDEQ
jgi:hypothetical protein